MPDGTVCASFDIEPWVQSLGVSVLALEIRGIENRPSHPDFDALRQETLASLPPKLSKELLRADPVLAGFRELHTTIGCSNREHIAAPEGLLSFLMKSGRLPSINLLVDIYNLVSLEELCAAAEELITLTKRFCGGEARFLHEPSI